LVHVDEDIQLSSMCERPDYLAFDACDVLKVDVATCMNFGGRNSLLAAPETACADDTKPILDGICCQGNDRVAFEESDVGSRDIEDGAMNEFGVANAYCDTNVSVLQHGSRGSNWKVCHLANPLRHDVDVCEFADVKAGSVDEGSRRSLLRERTAPHRGQIDSASSTLPCCDCLFDVTRWA